MVVERIAEGARAAPDGGPSHLALMPWGGVVEDFLGPIGIGRAAFAEETSGGWLFGYAAALAGQGIRTTILCPSLGADRPERRCNPATGVVTWFLPAGPLYRRLRRWPGDGDDPALRPPHRPGLRRAVRGLRRLAGYGSLPPLFWRTLAAEGCDAVMTQEYEHPRFDVVAAGARRRGLPLFASFQGALPAGSALERRVRAGALRAASGLVIGPAVEAERVRARHGLPPEAICRLPNPIDLALWRPEPRARCRALLGIPERAVVVVCHGRIDIHRKGLDVLLEAWRRVAAARPGADLRLHLVGSGQDDATLAAALARAPVPGLRWVRDYVQDRARMRRELGAADAYVLASRHEGFPVAPLEAMACGLGLVAADAPGVCDILPRGEADGGIVVARGDAAALAAALGRVVDDAALRAGLSARARARVEGFCSLEAVGARLAGFLRERAGAGVA